MKNYRPSIRHGVYLGLIAVFSHLIVYAVDPEIFLSKAYGTISTVILVLAAPIVLMVLGARDCKHFFSSYSFRKAFSAAFIVGLVAALISLLYTLLFVTVIDPEMTDWLYDEKMAQEMEKLTDAGYSDEMIERSMEMASGFKKYTTGVLGSTIMHGFFLLWYALLALIIGAIQKDKKQEDLIA
ncbi:DUF4199 domain-containing protein [Bacteroidia bacterium]|nr:DUF4199 domain-containing protein [Bacteroidia bacterium]